MVFAVRLGAAVLFSVFMAAPQTTERSAAKGDFDRGVQLFREKRFTEAATALESALKLDPKSSAAHHALGLVRLAQEDAAAATVELRKAVSGNPSSADAHLALGLALGQSGLLDEAATEFRAAIRLRPSLAEAHKRLGVTLRRQGDAKAALQEFELAVGADAKDPECWYNLGLARKSEGNLSGAIEAFRRAVTLKPDFEQAHYNLGMTLQAQGKADAARGELSQIRELRAFRTRLAESKAEILNGVKALESGDTDHALQQFQKAADSSPTLPTAWHYLGVAWDRKHDEKNAMQAWDRALELQADFPKTHASLGLFYARRGDYDRAAAELRKAIHSDPDEADAHYNLALVLAEQGHTESARQELAEALSINPANNSARIRLALLLSSAGEFDAAANLYREVIRREPQFPEAWNNLGLVLLQLNDYDGAKSAFARAITLKPGYAAAMQNASLTETCTFSSPGESLSIPHVSGTPELTLDPDSQLWKSAASGTIVKDCTRSLDYPDLATTVRAVWTDTDLYLLFVCPYRTLNLFMPSQNDKPRVKLWDRDVVEMFLGDDWNNIRHYREFEIAPTGDWIDLAIDLDKKNYDRTWRSGWHTMARIDEHAKVWYAAARIPLASVTTQHVVAGTRWRVNLYRIEGQGPDEKRHFMCWQPTCAPGRDPNHVPEHFGSITFGGPVR